MHRGVQTLYFPVVVGGLSFCSKYRKQWATEAKRYAHRKAQKNNRQFRGFRGHFRASEALNSLFCRGGGGGFRKGLEIVSLFRRFVLVKHTANSCWVSEQQPHGEIFEYVYLYTKAVGDIARFHGELEIARLQTQKTKWKRRRC